jgi:acetyl-CoA synthetase
MGGIDDRTATRPANIAFECIDRQVARGFGDDVAMRFVRSDGAPGSLGEALTYEGLAVATSRFADGLERLGIEMGQRVVVLAGRTPRTYQALLGCLRSGRVACPLFTAFGPEPIRARMEVADAAAVVTTRSHYRRKFEAIRDRSTARSYILIDVDDPADAPPDTLAWTDVVEAGGDVTDVAPTSVDSPALIHFTSGTTGTPKGALHVHGAVASHRDTARFVLGLGPGDVYWCTADPGWVTGTSYGIIGPLTVGATIVVDEAEFDPVRWYRILDGQGVQVWYTSPTALRMLMRAGDAARIGCDLDRLRDVFSVGEPLAADAVTWALRTIGLPVRDTWWQTETGSIMIATPAGDPIRPGSMGRPVPGVDISLIATDEEGSPVVDPDGHVAEVTEPDRTGMIAIRPGWASMFRAYVGAPDRYTDAFIDGWYLSGDLATRSDDGSYWFVGRSDDVIKTAGHLVGPFEIERVLDDHPDVIASGVYGVPDPVAGESVHACVTLRTGVDPGPSTVADIIAHCRRHLGASIAPRRIDVVDQLPVTRSGKIVRRILRARELGLGDEPPDALEADTGADLGADLGAGRT